MRGRVAPKAPSRLRRFDHAKGTRGGRVLDADHPAVLESRTLFPGSVVHVSMVKTLLKTGHNQSKLGKVVTKGKWRGFPIYALTLQERATCPSSCTHWLSCYGNGMHWAERVIDDAAMERRLWTELQALDAKHPDGFLVRLHILGDFYSVEYAQLWERALDAFPALHVFGYTARHPDGEDELGSELWALSIERFDRFALRFSGLDEPERGAVTIAKGADSEHVVCPAQRGKTECCATCGFCWQSQRTIAFEKH